MSKLQKWKLLSAKDVSPSPWFPIENRTYQIPNGQVVEDFFVTTLADSVHIIPMTTEGKFVMIRMYKQGTDEIMLQFPAGRFETKKHNSFVDVAVQELEEETGVKAKPEDFVLIRTVCTMSTKATEKVHIFFIKDVEFNSTQNLDDNEEIEVVLLTQEEIEQYIVDGRIWDAHVICDWDLLKRKFPEIFSKK